MSNPTYAEVARQRRDNHLAEVKTILDLAVAEKRDLTKQEVKANKRSFYQADLMQAEAKRADRADELAVEAMAIRGPLPTGEEMQTATRAPAQDVTMYPAEYAEMTNLVRRFESTGYAVAEFPISTRALQSAGGSAISSTFHDEVAVYARTANPMLDASVVTVYPVASGGGEVLPRLTADPAHGGTVTAEAAGIVELDATISAVTITPFKYGITQIWSAELETDTALGLQRLLAQSAGRELGLDAGVHLTTGTGTVQPTGWVGNVTNGGTASGGTATQGFDFIAPADLPGLFMSVAAPYRARGTWMASTSMYEKILSWRDSTDQPIVAIDPQNSIPTSLYGRPLVENPAMAAAASASVSLAFGDFGAAYSVVMLPLRVELSRDYKFNTDQLALRTILRLDGNVVDSAAVAELTSADT